MTLVFQPSTTPTLLARGLRSSQTVATAIAFPVGLVLLWALASHERWITDQILPAPTAIWQSFADQIADGSLLQNTLVSLRRVLYGFAAGVAFGLPLGLLLGVSQTARAYVSPVLQAITQVNAMAWIPVLVLFLGIDEALKIVIVGWSASMPIILGTQRGVAGVPSQFRELGRVLDLRFGDRLRLIVLPSSLPSIFTGLREGMANAWQTLVIVELFASFEGLGYLMTWGRQLFQLELVIVAMILIGAIGLTLTFLLGLLERSVQPWANGGRT